MNLLVTTCDCCGKKLTIGRSKVYNKPGYCGIYCSSRCFLLAYGLEPELLDLDKALDCKCDIYKPTNTNEYIPLNKEEKDLLWRKINEKEIR